VLHQGILVVVSAIGIGWVVNGFLADVASRRLVEWATWAPFALMYIASRAVRAALLIPIEPRANWIFRMTEDAAFRGHQLDAAVHAVRRLGVMAPAALLLPAQWMLLGPRTAPVLATTLLCGWVYVELLMKDWRRIPFTCSYLPGKRPVPQAIFIGLTLFVGFTTIGAALARLNLTNLASAAAADAILLLAIVVLRRRRFAACRDVPLEFEDALPTEVNALRLSQAE
jgi:hypothetical protein